MTHGQPGVAEPRCPYCNRFASQIQDVVIRAMEEEVSAADFARQDGTFNAATNEFCCDTCYENLGMPSAPGGWRAGDEVASAAG